MKKNILIILIIVLLPFAIIMKMKKCNDFNNTATVLESTEVKNEETSFTVESNVYNDAGQNMNIDNEIKVTGKETSKQIIKTEIKHGISGQKGIVDENGTSWQTFEYED